MGSLFEELDHQSTPMGDISLRRRRELTLDVDVYEAKLDDEFLMSTLFTVAEIALADLGLAVVEGDGLDVVVGGLGLGYTAQAVLADERVRSLHVIEALPQVIDWHRRGLLPISDALTSDPRCHLVPGDFFAMVASEDGFGTAVPSSCHAVLVDIDHSPSWLLHPAHAPFYEVAGLGRLVDRMAPGGVFGLWSDEPPAAGFLAVMDAVFPSVAAHVVPFPNPYAGGESTNSVYVGSLAAP
ncbi:spermidine synthase [Aquihabitans daechungensis]|uniref:spermidine synthase n=1 Tax=Aquihabitans daechungensis TaxID=1052257 RepID=UPI003BA34227